jgi:hypothetical protein
MIASIDIFIDSEMIDVDCVCNTPEAGIQAAEQ